MKKRILLFEIIGFFITSSAGVLLHFVFKWSNYNEVVALFAPVNESNWEHLKLLFFPYTIYAVVESIKFTSQYDNIYFAKLTGIISGMISTLSFAYLVSGSTGRNIGAVNIASYFIGMLCAYMISYAIIKSGKGRGVLNSVSIVALIIITLGFMFFTYFPVKIPLFADPQSFSYGIIK